MENLNKNVKRHLIDLEDDIREIIGKSLNIEIISFEKLLSNEYKYIITLKKGISSILEIIYSKSRNKSFLHLIKSKNDIIEFKTDDIINYKELILPNIERIIKEN